MKHLGITVSAIGAAILLSLAGCSRHQSYVQNGPSMASLKQEVTPTTISGEWNTDQIALMRSLLIVVRNYGWQAGYYQGCGNIDPRTLKEMAAMAIPSMPDMRPPEIALNKADTEFETARMQTASNGCSRSSLTEVNALNSKVELQKEDLQRAKCYMLWNYGGYWSQNNHFRDLLRSKDSLDTFIPKCKKFPNF
jgi:hypothetical protein